MKRRAMILKCDTCGQESHEMNTTNRVVAQRILVEHKHWKVYREDRWMLACPECVRDYLKEAKQ